MRRLRARAFHQHHLTQKTFVQRIGEDAGINHEIVADLLEDMGFGKALGAKIALKLNAPDIQIVADLGLGAYQRGQQTKIVAEDRQNRCGCDEIRGRPLSLELQNVLFQHLWIRQLAARPVSNRLLL